MIEPAGASKPRTPFGDPRFEVRRSDGRMRYIQHSMLYPGLEWEISQVMYSCTPGDPEYNEKAAYAKLAQKQDGSWAHTTKNMDCASCHTSWVTSCFGCHLPQEANWRTDMHHFEQKHLRNWASYNPQVARDDVFMLGISPDVKDNKVAVVRSSSAVMVSTQDAQRRIAYKQQLTVAGNGLNGQCFNTHFAHTVRKTETRKCSDCHLSEKNDNNAWLAQTLLQGTNYVNFFGMFAWVGEGDSGLEAVKITEWPEPQAVIGSNLHRMAFPDEYRAHEQNGRRLTEAHHHSGSVRSLEVRGEYLYTASGEDGFRVFDIANVANKDFSERITTAPVSPLGQDTHVRTRFATAIALPTNMSISMSRPWDAANREQNYPYKGNDQNLHESYRYAYVSDRFEGLILVGIDQLTDGDPDNNFLERAVTFNPGNALDGAESPRGRRHHGLRLLQAGGRRGRRHGPARAEDRQHGAREQADVDRGAVPLRVRDRRRRARGHRRHDARTHAEGRRCFRADRGRAQRLRCAHLCLRERGCRGRRRGRRRGPDRAEAARELHGRRCSGRRQPGQGRHGQRQPLWPRRRRQDGFARLAARDTRRRWPQRLRLRAGAATEAHRVLRDARSGSRAREGSRPRSRGRRIGTPVAVFGRIGGRPFTRQEASRLYLRDGKTFTVPDAVPSGWKRLLPESEAPPPSARSPLALIPRLQP
jgi:hypothetical protein